MSVYVVVKDGVVVGKFPRKVDGSIKAPENVFCGMLYKDGEFLNPPAVDIQPAPVKSRLDSLPVESRDELMDAILEGMWEAQIGNQVNWNSRMDKILAAWQAHGKPENKNAKETS